MAILEVNNLSKVFKISKKQKKVNKNDKNLKVAVKDLSFTVNEGEIYGLLGPNGAGKTTTLRMLSTLIKPTVGDAIISGYSIVKEPIDVRRKIAFLTSELKLDDYFTPNYLFDFFSGLYGLSKDESSKRKEELFKKFEIEEFKEVKFANLSTGMKQKTSIVVSLINDPDIIIFDEPTNGLDIFTAKVITDYLLELKNMGKTILLSTHIFSLVEKLCDRVGFIVDGSMFLEGSVKELTQEKSLEDVFFELYDQKLKEDA